MDHLNNILNDPQQNKTERTVREHLPFCTSSFYCANWAQRYKSVSQPFFQFVLMKKGFQLNAAKEFFNNKEDDSNI